MSLAPDVGLPEKVAHFYFTQLIKGLVSGSLGTTEGPLLRDLTVPRGGGDIGVCTLKWGLPSRHQTGEPSVRWSRWVPSSVRGNEISRATEPPKGNLKLSDFGLCSVFKYRGEERMLGDICGSPPYVAPEVSFATLSSSPVESDVGAAGTRTQVPS